MKNNLEELMEKCRTRAQQGMTGEELVAYLHGEGCTIADSIKVLKEICKLSLADAKELVTSNPVWADQVTNADILHEELETALRKKRLRN